MSFSPANLGYKLEHGLSFQSAIRSPFPMHIDTQDGGSESYPLAAIRRASSISGNLRPSSLQDRVPPSTSDITTSRVGDMKDPFSDAQERFAHLTLAVTQKNESCGPTSSERARKLKALPTCEKIKDIGLKSIEHWGKSFELVEQEHLFQDLEPLEALKNKTNSDLIQTMFESLVKYSAGVKSCYDEFKALRKSFDDLASAEHTTVDQQVEAVIKLTEELTENGTALGKNVKMILESKSDIWEFQKIAVKEAQDKIESVLHTEHDYQEDIQFTMDMLKDGERIAPRIKEPSGLATTFIEGVGKYGLLKLSKRYKHKLLVSKMQQTMYQGEKSKMVALNKNLEESKNGLLAARSALSTLERLVYTNILVVIQRVNHENPKVPFVAIANKLDETEGNLLTFMELIEDFLARINQEYGLKCGTREVRRLCSRVPNIFTALEMLLSAKEVIVDDHQHIYEEHLYELCKAISQHFNIMEEVYWECRNAVNVERQAAFVKDEVPKFQNGIKPYLEAIEDIAKTHISKTKSKVAYVKREIEDRFYGESALARCGRPLVTGDEVIWAMHKVVDALLLIQVVSNSTTASDTRAGENANCAEETAANDALAWFKMPKEVSDQFYDVLFGEAKKLKFLQDQRQANARLNSNRGPETEGRFASLRRFMARKSR